jgi:mono/diheme cytochrome c family protein
MKYRFSALVLASCLVVLLPLLGVSHLAKSRSKPSTALQTYTGLLPIQVLTQPIAESAPNAAQLRRGQYLVIAGDCMSCHLRDGGEPLAGGLELNTPFGVIYTPNITSDAETGIGNWTADDFHRAMHDGIGIKDKNIYPAFPYPWFRTVSRADNDAILAFLKTTPPVRYSRPPNKLIFPLGFRAILKGWNLLYLKSRDFQFDPSQSSDWNRGAYLVNGLGHCGACHTPKNALGADNSNLKFQGGSLDNWVAPDLTANDRIGLGSWSVGDIEEYLRTGRNARAGAGGPMGEVVTYSTSLMTDADRHAISVYIKSQAASPSVVYLRPGEGVMRRGAAIYSDACASCHLENGVGQPHMFPPLPQNAMLQQYDPTGLEHALLAGSRLGTSASRPTPLTMPSFAWKLTDQEIADVSTYIRNSWGNQAPLVSTSEVRAARRRLGLESVHFTANSGDQN